MGSETLEEILQSFQSGVYYRRKGGKMTEDDPLKELNEEQGSGGSTFNNYGTYTEVHAGGVNINNKKEDAGH